MISYNLSFEKLQNIYKRNILKKQYGGSHSLQIDKTIFDGLLLEQNKGRIINYLDTIDLNKPIEDKTIIKYILDQDIPIQLKIDIVNYLIANRSAGFYMDFKHTEDKLYITADNIYKYYLNNLTIEKYNTDADKQLELLNLLLSSLNMEIETIREWSSSVNYIESLYLSINFGMKLADNKSNFFEQISLINNSVNKLLASIKGIRHTNLDYNFIDFKYFLTIFNFLWQTINFMAIDTDYFLKFFGTDLLSKINELLCIPRRSADMLYFLTEIFNIINSTNPHSNKDLFLKPDKNGTLVLHHFFLYLIPKNPTFPTDQLLDFFTSLIDMFNIADNLLSQNTKKQNTTVLHNAIFNGYPIEIISHLISKAPGLLELADQKKKYPAFYVAEYTSGLPVFVEIANKTPVELLHTKSTNNKIPLEFLMVNVKQIEYPKTLFEKYIKDNNHLALISSIQLFTIIIDMGLYSEDMKYKGKSFPELVSYFLNKKKRDREQGYKIDNLQQLFDYIGAHEIRQETQIHGLPLRRNGNIILQYIDFLKANGSLNSSMGAIRFLTADGQPEPGVDAGGVERTAWGEMKKEIVNSYCDEINGKFYLKIDLTDEQYILIGNIIGRAYRYGPRNHNYIHVPIALIDSNISIIIKLGIFKNMTEEALNKFIIAEATPNESSFKERLYQILNTWIIDMDVDLTSPVKDLQEGLKEYLEMLGLEDEALYKICEAIILKQDDVVDPIFINFATQLKEKIAAIDASQLLGDDKTKAKIQSFFEEYKASELEVKLESPSTLLDSPRTITELFISNQVTYYEDMIKPYITQFTIKKNKIIEGIDQVIYGFFDVDVRRIMNVNLEPLPITKRILRNASVFSGMSPIQMQIMGRTVDLLLNSLDIDGNLPKYIQFFGGMPMRLDESEEYKFTIAWGDRIVEHTCFYYVEIPAGAITRGNEQILAQILKSQIEQVEQLFTMG